MKPNTASMLAIFIAALPWKDSNRDIIIYKENELPTIFTLKIRSVMKLTVLVLPA